MCPDAAHRWRRNRIYEFGSRAARAGSRLYAQVAEQLIQDAVQEAGDGPVPLAQERELASRLHVSRSTIRNALALLEKYDLVQRRRSHGTVLVRPADEVLQVWRLHEKRLLVFQFSPVAVRAQDWYGHILTSLLAAAKAHRQTVEIRYCLNPLEVRQELQGLRNGERIAGVVLCGDVDSRFIDHCRKHDIACVCVDYWPHDDLADAVAVDVEAEAFLAAAHLAQLGIRSVGFAAFGRHRAGQPDVCWDADVWRFLAHLRRAAYQYRLEVREEWLVVVPGAAALAKRPRKPLLGLASLPQAMICFNGGVAGQMLEAVRKAGLRCPQDIALISRGYWHSDKIQLTRLENCTEEIGRVALRLALERIYHWRTRPLRVAVASRLVPGDSTRSVKPSAQR